MKKTEVQTKLEALGDNDEIILRTPDEEKTFLENYAKITNEKTFNEWKDKEVGEWHKRLESDITEVTGLSKPDHTLKSYDWLKSTLKDLKTKASEVDELRVKLKNGNADPELKKELEAVQRQYKELQAKTEAQIGEYKSKLQVVQIDNELEKAMFGLEFATTIDESVRKVFVSNMKAELIKMAAFDSDGLLVFKDEKGEILRNPGDLKPLSASAIIPEKLKPILKEGVVRKGTGTGKEGQETPTGNYIPSAAIKTRTQLHEDMLKSGFKKGSEQWMKTYNKYAPNLQA